MAKGRPTPYSLLVLSVLSEGMSLTVQRIPGRPARALISYFPKLPIVRPEPWDDFNDPATARLALGLVSRIVEIGWLDLESVTYFGCERNYELSAVGRDVLETTCPVGGTLEVVRAAQAARTGEMGRAPALPGDFADVRSIRPGPELDSAALHYLDKAILLHPSTSTRDSSRFVEACAGRFPAGEQWRRFEVGQLGQLCGGVWQAYAETADGIQHRAFGETRAAAVTRTAVISLRWYYERRLRRSAE